MRTLDGRALSLALGCLALGLASPAAATAAAHAAPQPAGHAAKAAAKGKAKKKGKRKHAAKRRKGTAKAQPKRVGGAMLSGSGAPGKRLGQPGDFYLRTSDHTLYGPKTARGWGDPVSLVGPSGAAGAQGPAGPQGAAGAPAFNAPTLTTLPTVTVTGSYDSDGSFQSSSVQAGVVQVPAGAALVRVSTKATPGAGWTPSSGVSCSLSSPSTYLTGTWSTDASLTDEELAWSIAPAPASYDVRCSVDDYTTGTTGATVSATADVQVSIHPANLPSA